ncbi:hypothetical protein DL768_011862 [Monosporascus sp. mg162]|nr:hypothetical protein DL768_011862 [Monosporascus sp. mg162]
MPTPANCFKSPNSLSAKDAIIAYCQHPRRGVRASAHAAALPGTEEAQQRRKISVVILGAGVAGITAAQGPINNSATDFLILERNDYISSRVRCCPFGAGPDDRTPYTVEPGAEAPRGEHVLELQQHPDRGFATFIEGEAAEFLAPGDPHLLLGTVARDVAYGPSGVTVRLDCGDCVEARSVVCAFSIGTYTKIFIESDEKAFWDPGAKFFLYADARDRGYYPVFQLPATPGFLGEGSNILFVTVVVATATTTVGGYGGSIEREMRHYEPLRGTTRLDEYDCGDGWPANSFEYNVQE